MVVPLPACDPGPFRLLVRVLHGEVVPLHNSFVVELLAVAKQFGAVELAAECSAYIAKSRDPAHVCHMLCMARLYDEPAVMQRCLALVDERPESVAAGVLELPSELLALLVSRGSFLLPGGEAAIYELILRWAEGMQRTIRGQGLSLQQLAAPVLEHVRFGLLSGAELQEVRQLFAGYATIARRVDKVLTAQFEQRAAASDS